MMTRRSCLSVVRNVGTRAYGRNFAVSFSTYSLFCSEILRFNHAYSPNCNNLSHSTDIDAHSDGTLECVQHLSKNNNCNMIEITIMATPRQVNMKVRFQKCIAYCGYRYCVMSQLIQSTPPTRPLICKATLMD